MANVLNFAFYFNYNSANIFIIIFRPYECCLYYNLHRCDAQVGDEITGPGRKYFHAVSHSRRNSLSTICASFLRQCSCNETEKVALKSYVLIRLKAVAAESRNCIGIAYDCVDMGQGVSHPLGVLHESESVKPTQVCTC